MNDRTNGRNGNGKWICAQLGAREHYAVPRALHRRDRLDGLFTDFWVASQSWFSMNDSLAERFHPELANAPVHASNMSALSFEAQVRLNGLAHWTLILKRNQWFQRQTVAQLARNHHVEEPGAVTLFAYSYAALSLLEFARSRGWRTVLGQIDPGLPEERMVTQLCDENPALRGEWQPAPADYWQNWRQECALADQIVVNSQWSGDALVQEGVAVEKISIVPLAFESTLEMGSFERHYPPGFTTKRPLRVLFLGQINLRKGVGRLLDAVRWLREEPVEFWFVGPIQIALPDEFKRNEKIRWAGAVPRGEVAKYYREADLFIFPTLSDGFGLTQLEAQAWKMPVVASRFCGDVVRDGVNGVLLPEVSGEAIASVLVDLLRNPRKLRDMAAQCGVDDTFSLKSLALSLLNL